MTNMLIGWQLELVMLTIISVINLFLCVTVPCFINDEEHMLMIVYIYCNFYTFGY